jgi:ABC-type Fe3+/spermidine/putrescine transport system ATPase subunit
MSRFAAGFVGRMNDWPGKVVDARPDQIAVHLDDGRVCVAGGSATEVTDGQQVVAVTRPESLTMSAAVGSDAADAAAGDDATGTNRWPATLRRVTYLGSLSECVLDCAGRQVEVTGPPDLPFGEGDQVVLSARPESVWLVPAS